MAHEIRICNPFEADDVLIYKNGKFTGYLGEYANAMNELIGRGTNATVVIRSRKEGVGELITGSDGAFSGCLGQLQQNLSDFLLHDVSFPLEIINVTQGHLVYESKEAFITFYNATGLKSAQVLSSVTSFDRYVWLLCLLTLFSGSIVLNLISYASKNVKEDLSECEEQETTHEHSRLWQVFVHMIAYGSLFDDSGLPRKTLSSLSPSSPFSLSFTLVLS